MDLNVEDGSSCEIDKELKEDENFVLQVFLNTAFFPRHPPLQFSHGHSQESTTTHKIAQQLSQPPMLFDQFFRKQKQQCQLASNSN